MLFLLAHIDFSSALNPRHGIPVPIHARCVSHSLCLGPYTYAFDGCSNSSASIELAKLDDFGFSFSSSSVAPERSCPAEGFSLVLAGLKN